MPNQVNAIRFTSRIRGIILVIALMFLAGPAQAQHDQPAPTAQLKALFPTAEKFVSKDLGMEDQSPQGEDLRARIAKLLGEKLNDRDVNVLVYIATRGGRSQGAAWAAQATLVGKKTRVLVGVDLKGRIVGVALIDNPIPVLQKAEFLNQFKGQTANQVGQRLKPAPKAPDASRAVAKSVRKAAAVLTEGLKLK